MNKRYKLIKEYPNSPKLGTVVTLTEELIGMWTTRQFYSYTSSSGNVIEISTSNIENFSEFWEEIIPLQYQVISTEFWVSGDRAYVQKDGTFQMHLAYSKQGGGSTLESLLNTGWRIHSVKRLTDGKVFTVGEEVHYDDTERTTTIYGFKLDDNYRSGLCITSPIGGSEFLYIRKIEKKKLFTTSDGVDVYEGDKFYYFDSYSYKILKGIGKKEFKPHQSFHDYEKAKQFAIENKPCLSLKDVRSVLNPTVTYQYHVTTINKLKEKVENIVE